MSPRTTGCPNPKQYRTIRSQAEMNRFIATTGIHFHQATIVGQVGKDLTTPALIREGPWRVEYCVPPTPA